MVERGYQLIQPHEFPQKPHVLSPPQLPASVPIIQPHLFPTPPPILPSSSLPRPIPWKVVPKPSPPVSQPGPTTFQQLCLHCRHPKPTQHFARGLACSTHSVLICFKCLQQTNFVTCPVCSRALAVSEKGALVAEMQALQGNSG